MTLPNFLVIGAAKAGTTSLYEHLRAHPQVFMPRLKEPRFFCYGGEGDRINYPIQSLEEYEALFKAAGHSKAIGEASVHYLTRPDAAERIHATIPNAKLIASLRNPVDRSYSIYQMNRRDRGINSDISFGAAVLQDPNLQAGYSTHLSRFFNKFSQEQIHIMLLEDLEAKPHETVKSVFTFLDVDAAFVPDLAKIANSGGEPRIRALHSVLSNRRLIAASRRVLPEAFVAPFKALRQRNLQKQALPAPDRQAAVNFFRKDILRTQEIIGRDLSHWLRA